MRAAHDGQAINLCRLAFGGAEEVLAGAGVGADCLRAAAGWGDFFGFAVAGFAAGSGASFMPETGARTTPGPGSAISSRS